MSLFYERKFFGGNSICSDEGFFGSYRSSYITGLFKYPLFIRLLLLLQPQQRRTRPRQPTGCSFALFFSEKS